VFGTRIRDSLDAAAGCYAGRPSQYIITPQGDAGSKKLFSAQTHTHTHAPNLCHIIRRAEYHQLSESRHNQLRDVNFLYLFIDENLTREAKSAQ
jgi:hypothetical protein